MADGDIKLSDSPNVDKGYVEKDSKMHRTLLLAEPEGTLIMSDSANVDTGYVVDGDGKKHRVHLVAEPEGTLEMSDNASTDTGYVIDGDGKKHKVKLVATLAGGGSTINNEDITITENGTYTASEGYTGLGEVVVSVAETKKYNATVSTFLGDLDENGIVQSPTAPTDLVFTGVKGFTSITSTMGVFFRRFQNLSNIGSVSFPDLESITTAWAMAYAFYNAGLTSVVFDKLKTINAGSALGYAFNSCALLKTVDMSKVETIASGNALTYCFEKCTELTSLDLSNLTTINGASCQNMCQGCSKLTSVNMSKLKTIINPSSSGALTSAFQNCTALASISFDSLDDMTNATNCLSYAFRYCSALRHVYFGAVKSTTFGTNTNQFQYMLMGCTNVQLHFPSNMDQTVIQGLAGYPNFGGTSTSCVYDLPAV